MSARRKRHDNPWPLRNANNHDRWHVGRREPGIWYARPKGVGVYADLPNRRREIFFRTWTEALTHAITKASTTR